MRKTYAKRSNVYRTPEGTFCARKCVKGVKVCKTFKLKRDAVNYINKISS
jgi:hypothetical protein